MTHAQRAPERNRQSAVPKHVASKRVLLVDADEVSRRILSWLLESEGYLVTTCGSTVGALDLVSLPIIQLPGSMGFGSWKLSNSRIATLLLH